MYTSNRPIFRAPNLCVIHRFQCLFAIYSLLLLLFCRLPSFFFIDLHTIYETQRPVLLHTRREMIAKRRPNKSDGDTSSNSNNNRNKNDNNNNNNTVGDLSSKDAAFKWRRSTWYKQMLALVGAGTLILFLMASLMLANGNAHSMMVRTATTHTTTHNSNDKKTCK